MHRLGRMGAGSGFNNSGGSVHRSLCPCELYTLWRIPDILPSRTALARTRLGVCGLGDTLGVQLSADQEANAQRFLVLLRQRTLAPALDSHRVAPSSYLKCFRRTVLASCASTSLLNEAQLYELTKEQQTGRTDEYFVGAILDHKETTGGLKHLVKWLDGSTTWEPKENLRNSLELVRNYHKGRRAQP